MPTFAAQTLAAITQSLFEAAKVPAADAALVARSLVDANLCGHDSHGVMRVPQYIDFLRKGTFKPGVALTTLNETPAVLAADANWGLGQVQAYRLLNQLIPKARSLGVAAGTLRNCGHVGRLGEYAEFAAQEKMALFAAVNSHGSGRRVAPPGGTEGRISTNPDLHERADLRQPGRHRLRHQRRGRGQGAGPVPEEAAVSGRLAHRSHAAPDDRSGRALQRTARQPPPLRRHAGLQGLRARFALDMLCGGLSGGACSNPAFPLPGIGNAAVFILLDPTRFLGVDHFVKETDGLSAYVRLMPDGCRSDRPSCFPATRNEPRRNAGSSRAFPFPMAPGNSSRRRPASWACRCPAENCLLAISRTSKIE